MSKKLILSGWCVFFSLITTAQSQDSLQNIISLKEIVVSASKIPLERKETAKPVQVIDFEQIQRSEGKDLAQLLHEQSGLVINGAFSNPGKNKDVFIRGASSEYTLVLIDGIPITDAAGLGGAFDLRLLPLQQVERIEILKGSQSTLYGSDAIAGVINIITRGPKEGIFSFDAALSAGSLNTSQASLSVSGKADVLGYNIGYSRFYTEGISEATDNVDTVDFDKDGSQREAFQANFELTPSTSLKISPFVRYTDLTNNYDDGSFADAANIFTSEVFNPGTRITYLKNNFQINGLYSFVQTDRKFNSSFGESVFKGRTHNLDIIANYRLNENFQVIGGIYRQEAKVLDDEATEKDPSFTITSPYVSLLVTGFNKFNAELGYRLNDHSEYGNEGTYSAAVSYDISPRVTLFGTYGTGFKSPNLNQLFGRFGPNPDLKPQSSRSYEGGLRFNLLDQKLSGELTYFDRSIEDVIIYDFSVGYQNRDEQNDFGVEASFTYQFLPRWSLTAHYNFVDGEVTLPLTSERDSTFHNLIRRPKHSFMLSLNAEPIKHLFISLQGQYLGDRSDSFYNSENFQTEPASLDAYFLVNGYVSYEATSALTIFADVKNITDTDYIESTGFSTLGFNMQAGIQVHL
ncbi:TonB-dependent receptor [Fulvivirgaceae bacterium BMA12]|uniref:TonB-dependent receptor n=1 Tax=Agaribacillus aureus TaxID=3051825 RepID=A0ABT8L3C1_9BACT|nr:TonB-dependent receptor [Fulvivirgaceae bacterium BMA12]